MEKLVGRKFQESELEDVFLFCKGELESKEGDTLKIDIKDSNRPDLWSVEGIARELKGNYRVEKGLPKHSVKKSGLKIIVDKKVNKVRPKVVAAIVKNVKFDDNAIIQLIQLQEKVTLTFGKKREQAAIGVYDFDKIKWPVKYTTVKPDGMEFVPLEYKVKMTPREILIEHPKGREYKHLLEKAKEYPLLIDSKKQVLSMPPIINSEYTGKVDEKTKNVLIEVTGFNLEIISTALNVITTALADREGKIESLEILEGKKKIITPDLSSKEFVINPDNCRKILGLKISNKEIIRLLEEGRYDAKETKNKIKVRYPAYRSDIMHERDVIEDIAVSFGYNDFEPESLRISTTGSSDKREDFSDKIREVMVGYGLQEIMTFTLTNKNNLFDKMNIKQEKIVEIANPVSETWNSLRNWLLPNIMEFLSKNTNVEYPQRIFEVGDVVVIDEKAETKTRDIRKLCVAIASKEAAYTEMKSIADNLLSSFNVKYKIKELNHPSFIDGRAAQIIVNNKQVGFLGEIHPKVLETWGLEVPVTAFELNLEYIESN